MPYLRTPLDQRILDYLKIKPIPQSQFSKLHFRKRENLSNQISDRSKSAEIIEEKFSYKSKLDLDQILNKTEKKQKLKKTGAWQLSSKNDYTDDDDNT